MEDVRGSTSGMGERSSSSTSTTHLRRKVVPPSDWMEDSNGHYLLVELPGFKKEEVKFEVNISTGHITISGEREGDESESEYSEETESEDSEETESEDSEETESEHFQETESEQFEGNGSVYFEESFTIPPNSDVNMITSKWDGERLHVTRPKVAAAVEAKNIRKREHEDGILRTAMKIMLSKKKGIIITAAVVAVSLGMLISGHMQDPISTRRMRMN